MKKVTLPLLLILGLLFVLYDTAINGGIPLQFAFAQQSKTDVCQTDEPGIVNCHEVERVLADSGISDTHVKVIVMTGQEFYEKVQKPWGRLGSSIKGVTECNRDPTGTTDWKTSCVIEIDCRAYDPTYSEYSPSVLEHELMHDISEALLPDNDMVCDRWRWIEGAKQTEIWIESQKDTFAAKYPNLLKVSNVCDSMQGRTINEEALFYQVGKWFPGNRKSECGIYPEEWVNDWVQPENGMVYNPTHFKLTHR